MSKLATFEDGLPTAFYDPAIHGENIPSDAVEITDDQWQEFISNQGLRKWDGSNVVVYEPPAPPITSEDVNAERDRRTATLFAYGGVAYQCDDRSQQNITAKGAQAKFAVIAGAQANDLRWANPNADFGWITTGNSVIPMDAQTMSAFADAADLWVTSHIMAGLALKQMDPIPIDFADGKWWPT